MFVVIVGGGKTGAHLARLLNERGHRITLVEQQPERCEVLTEMLPQVRIVCGDGDEPYVLDSTDLRTADVVVAATGHDEDNLVVCLLSEIEYEVPLAIARINNPANEWLFTQHFGVDIPVSGTNVMFSVIESEVSLGDIVTLLKLRADEMAIDEVILAPDASAVGKAIAGLALPADSQIMVLIRDGKVVPPRGDTVLAAGDELLVLCRCGSEDSLRTAFGVRSEPKP